MNGGNARRRGKEVGMPNFKPDDELLSAALRRTNNCPPLEDLERLLEAGAPTALQGHVDHCPHCRTELEMLRSFTSNEIAEHEKPAVNVIAARLKTRPAINRNAGRAAIESHHAWWKRMLEV